MAIYSCIHSFIQSFIHSFIRSFINSFIYSFIHSCRISLSVSDNDTYNMKSKRLLNSCLFNHSFIYSFIQSFISLIHVACFMSLTAIHGSIEHVFIQSNHDTQQCVQRVQSVWHVPTHPHVCLCVHRRQVCQQVVTHRPLLCHRLHSVRLHRYLRR